MKAESKTKDKKEIVLILNDIRSVHNVGSIFRTADAAGVFIIYLCGHTPAPIDRFGRKRRDFAKVALGAEDTVAWEERKDIFELIKSLKDESIYIVSVELSPDSINYKQVKKAPRICFILGSETEGLSKKILEISDEIAELPMLGKKESLNVSVVAGIILYSAI
jgi:tRNA G18 (ribose-2'-O)-methylase SpoU